MNTDAENQKWKKNLLLKCDSNKYEKYNQKISVVENDNYIHFSIDSIRIYLSPEFAIGFHSNEKTESLKKYTELKEQYGGIFKNGFVTGKMMACEIEKDCELRQQIVHIKRDGEIVEEKLDLFDYVGPTIKILEIKELPEYKTDQRRVIEIWATSGKLESGWGGFSIFYVDLKNENGSKISDLNTFLIGAELNCFRYAYSQV